MYVLGISGSPRKGSHSEILLDRALDGARAAGAEVEKIILNELGFKPCQECGGCDKTGECVIPDSMTAIYEKFDRADGVIIASPIFFGSLTAQAKMMIDRFQARWVRKYILKKQPARRTKQKGVFLCVGGWKIRKFFDSAEALVKILFTILDIEYLGGLFAGGVEKKADISERKDLLEEAYDLGARLVRS